MSQIAAPANTAPHDSKEQPTTEQRTAKIKRSASVGTNGMRRSTAVVHADATRAKSNTRSQRSKVSARPSDNDAPPRRSSLSATGAMIVQTVNPTHRVVAQKTTASSSGKASSRALQNDLHPKFLILPGNNSALVREAFQRRPWWTETTDDDLNFNFKWKETGQSLMHDSLNTNPNYKQIVNHLDGNIEICTKTALFRNLKAFCDQHAMNIFDYVPVTMIVKSVTLNVDIAHLRKLYKLVEAKGDESKAGNEGSKNIWIVKPSCLNRGNGIQLFNTLASMEAYIQSNQPNSGPPSPSKDQPQHVTPAHLLRVAQQSGSWIVQKYIERPLLIHGRKFDIRSYCLLVFRTSDKYVPFTPPVALPTETAASQEQPSATTTDATIEQQATTTKKGKGVVLNAGIRSLLTNHRRTKSPLELEAHFYKKAYLRTSSREFTTDKIEDLNVHLTNNAVQKYADDYGKYEEGNQLSLDQFQEYMSQHHPTQQWSVEGNLIPKIKELMALTVMSAHKYLVQRAHKYTFELFGFDFMIDERMKVYLLEVNTNPCLALSSQILRELLPDLVEDVLRLAVDPVFPPPESTPYHHSRPSNFEQIL